MLVQGMAETLCACPPIQDAAKSLPCVRTWCSGQTAAVDRSTYRPPNELSPAPGPLARGANISRNRPRSSSGSADVPQALDVVQETAAWHEGGPRPTSHRAMARALKWEDSPLIRAMDINSWTRRPRGGHRDYAIGAKADVRRGSVRRRS
jgi:hypothetical protein